MIRTSSINEKTVSRVLDTGTVPTLGTQPQETNQDSGTIPDKLANNACNIYHPCFISNPNNYLMIERKEEVNSLFKGWECTYEAYHVESTSGNKSKLGDITVRLSKRPTHKQFNTYDGTPSEQYIPRLVIRRVATCLPDEKQEVEVIKLLLEAVIQRSRELGLDGRVEWNVNTLSEFENAMNCGLLKSKNIKETNEQIANVLSVIGTEEIYEKIKGLSFDMHHGVRIYLPVKDNGVQSNQQLDSKHNFRQITDEEYDALFPSKTTVLTQGDIGDCYLIASLKSIAESKKGRNILKRLIEVGDNFYKVTFPAFPDVPVFIEKQNPDTSTDTSLSESFVSGDIGFKLLEQAYEKFLLKQKYGIERLPELSRAMLNSSYPGNVLYVMTGVNPTCFNTECENSIKVHEDTFHSASLENPQVINGLNNFIEGLKTNADDFIITATTANHVFPSVGDDRFMDKENKRFPCNHALSIVKIDDRKIFIVDPRDGDKVYELSYEDFAKYFSAIQAVKVTT